MLRLYNKSFAYIYGLQSYETLQIVKKYAGRSQLKIVFTAADNAVHFVEQNGWIVDEEGEPFVVRHIEQTDESVTVIAYGGHALLEQRVTIPGVGDYAVSATGSTDAVVKALINASLRGLPLATAAANSGTSITEQSRLKNLGDEVLRILAGVGRGEQFTMDADNSQIIFDTYLGVDRSRGNAEDTPPVVFAQQYRNIEGYKYKTDYTRMQSTVYVGGAGEGADREIAVVGDAAAGIDRVERFIDARDVEAGDATLLGVRGAQAVIPAQETAELTALADANLVYGTDYALGDIITTIVEQRTYEAVDEYFNPVVETVAVNQRITEVCITRTPDGMEYVDLRFGDEPITPSQVQTLRAEVAQLSSVEPAADTGTVHEVPAGGDAGQVLKKISGDDYDAAWAADKDSGGDVIAPATHAASYVPMWNATANSKTLVQGKELSGTDATIISGTKGTSGNLAKWDENGDAVDSLLPASSAPILVNRQDHTTNNTVSNQLIQCGWFYIKGDGSAKHEYDLTFPVAFDNIPIVVGNVGRFAEATANGAPENAADFTTENSTLPWAAITPLSNGTGAKIAFERGTTLSASYYYGIYWIAIGTKART